MRRGDDGEQSAREHCFSSSFRTAAATAANRRGPSDARRSGGVGNERGSNLARAPVSIALVLIPART
jgi:hypothetical protein